jgi:hypothetical protein
MRLTCERCKRGYDDAGQWTICPHSPLGFSATDYCPFCDTLESVHGPCRHQEAATKLMACLTTTPQEGPRGDLRPGTIFATHYNALDREGQQELLARARKCIPEGGFSVAEANYIFGETPLGNPLHPDARFDPVPRITNVIINPRLRYVKSSGEVNDAVREGYPRHEEPPEGGGAGG